MAENINLNVDLDTREAEKKLNKLGADQDVKVDADFSGAEKEAKQFAKEAEDVINKGIGGAFDNITKTANSSFENIKSSALGFSDAFTGGLAGGLIGGGLAGAVTTITEGLISGIQSAFEFSEEITRLQNNIQNLTGLQGKELNNFSARITATASTFGEDSEEIFRSAQKLAAQTGEDINVVLDNIQKGFVSGANSSGELLAVTQEYGNVIKEVGGSSEDLIKILQRSEQTGVFSDKGIDVVKEFGLRIRELPQSTKDALQGIGLDAEDIQARLESGQSNVLDILSETSTALGQLPAQSSAVGTAIADIFGGPGEDAGLQYLLTLKDINNETVNLDDNLTEAQKRQQETLENSTKFNTIFIELFGGLSNGLTDFLNNLKSGFVQILDIVDLGGFFTGLKEGFSTTLDAAQPLFNFIKNVLGAAVITVIESFKTFANTIQVAFEVVVNAINPIFVLIEDIVAEFQSLFDGVGDGINVFDTFRDIIEVLLKVAIKPLEIAISVITGILRFLFNLFISGVQIIRDFYNESALLQGLFKALGEVAGFVGSAIRGLLETLGILDKQEPAKPIRELKEEQEKVVESTKELNTEIPTLNNNVKTFNKTVKETSLEDFITQLAILRINGKETSKEYENLIQQALKLKTSQDALAESIKIVKAELESYGKSIEVTNVETSSLVETSKNGFNELTKDLKNRFADLQQAQTGLSLKTVETFQEQVFWTDEVIKRNLDLGDSIRNIGGEYSNFYASLNENIIKSIELNKSGTANWEDYGAVLGDVLGQSAALFEENTELQKALSVTQAIVNTAVAVTKALALPFPLNIVQAGVIGALGAVQVATILGAEDGVIDLDGSYNKKPGKTDTIPFMLARGESVTNAKATALNKPYLEYINNGGDMNSLFGGLAGRIEGTNNRLEKIEKALYKSTLIKSNVNLVVENKNNSNIKMGAVRV